MKIVLISFLYEIEIGGGAAKVVNELALGLKRLENRVVVITTHGEKKPTIETINGIHVYRILPKNLYWIADKDHQPIYKRVMWQLLDIWNLDTYRQVKLILDWEKPDIVHVHKLRGLSPSVWHAARASGCRRIVQSCHDFELESPVGTMTGVVGEMARRDHWALRPYSRLRARFSKLVDVATAPSAYTLKELTDSGFFPNARHEIIPNSHGFNLAQLSRIRERMTNLNAKNCDTKFRFLYLGRLEDNKGVDSLCAAFVAIAKRHQNVFLDIVGWGIEEEKLKHKYASHSQITFCGPAFGEQKMSILADATVLVVPSDWPEVFGIVVLEAYAYGMPVIASAVGGLPELVQDGVTGYLVPADDQEALKEKLDKFAARPGLASQMSGACFEAAKNYTTDLVTNRYLNTYQ